MSIAVAVLAGGASTRLGAPKQLLPVGGSTLLAHTLGAARECRCGPVRVVLGAHCERVACSLGLAESERIDNPSWAEGIASSVRAAVEHLARIPAVEGILFAVCDQPHLSAAALRQLVDAHRRTGSGIVAAAYAGTVGVPALFTRPHFPELLSLRGDQGARVLLRGNAALGVPLPELAVDLDTPEDVRRHLQLAPTRTHALHRRWRGR